MSINQRIYKKPMKYSTNKLSKRRKKPKNFLYNHFQTLNAAVSRSTQSRFSRLFCVNLTIRWWQPTCENPLFYRQQFYTLQHKTGKCRPFHRFFPHGLPFPPLSPPLTTLHCLLIPAGIFDIPWDRTVLESRSISHRRINFNSDRHRFHFS